MAVDSKLNLNGHSLAALSGAKTRQIESVRFPASSLDQAMEQIRALGATGEMTLKFNRGEVVGEAQFESHTKEK